MTAIFLRLENRFDADAAPIKNHIRDLFAADLSTDSGFVALMEHDDLHETLSLVSQGRKSSVIIVQDDSILHRKLMRAASSRGMIVPIVHANYQEYLSSIGKDSLHGAHYDPCGVYSKETHKALVAQSNAVHAGGISRVTSNVCRRSWTTWAKTARKELTKAFKVLATEDLSQSRDLAMSLFTERDRTRTDNTSTDRVYRNRQLVGHMILVTMFWNGIFEEDFMSQTDNYTVRDKPKLAELRYSCFYKESGMHDTMLTAWVRYTDIEGSFSFAELYRNFLKDIGEVPNFSESLDTRGRVGKDV